MDGCLLDGIGKESFHLPLVVVSAVEGMCTCSALLLFSAMQAGMTLITEIMKRVHGGGEAV